jgi:hypothetical protein
MSRQTVKSKDFIGDSRPCTESGAKATDGGATLETTRIGNQQYTDFDQILLRFANQFERCTVSGRKCDIMAAVVTSRDATHMAQPYLETDQVPESAIFNTAGGSATESFQRLKLFSRSLFHELTRPSILPTQIPLISHRPIRTAPFFTSRINYTEFRTTFCRFIFYKSGSLFFF